MSDNGAVPLAELQELDSEVHHLREQVAERHVDYRSEFRVIREEGERMRVVVEKIGREMVRGRTLLIVLVALATMGLPIAAVVTPWMARAAVRDVLIEQGLLRTIQQGGRP